MKLEICSFSGQKIYPGRGKVFVRQDSRVFRLINGKAESLLLQRKNPRKIHWTVVFRKQHKKGITEEVAKKRTRRNVKHQRGIVGATLEKIKEQRSMKPEEKKAVRDAAIQKAKELKKKKEASKPAQKTSSTQKTASKVAKKGGKK
ncbi:hypothetical protein MP638_001990 [Amoeboaphelidium occidentale]|nr:hypothetical protein MP638_001990 [Amoeboaphelidium occidentale]